MEYHVDTKLFKFFNNDKLVAELPGAEVLKVAADMDESLRYSE
jgi:hypothetical protein